MEEDLHERFLKANANSDFIAGHFADVVRNLIRAVAANDPSRPLYLAAEEMRFVIELLQRCEKPVTWYSLFIDAIASIQAHLPDDPDDRKYIRAAQDGMKYLVESSATDNAARGRASRRLSEFMSMIDYSQKARRGDV